LRAPRGLRYASRPPDAPPASRHKEVSQMVRLLVALALVLSFLALTVGTHG